MKKGLKSYIHKYKRMEKGRKRQTTQENKKNEERRVVVSDKDIKNATERFFYNSIEKCNKENVPEEVRPQGLRSRMMRDPEYIAIGAPYYIAGNRGLVEEYLNSVYPQDKKNHSKTLSDRSITFDVIKNKKGPVYEEFMEFSKGRKNHTSALPQTGPKRSREDHDRIVEEYRRKLGQLGTYLNDIKSNRLEKVAKKEGGKDRRKNLWSRIKRLQEDGQGHVLNITNYETGGSGAKSEKMFDKTSIHVKKVQIGDMPIVVSNKGAKQVKMFFEDLAAENSEIDVDDYIKIFHDSVKELNTRKKQEKESKQKKDSRQLVPKTKKVPAKINNENSDKPPELIEKKQSSKPEPRENKRAPPKTTNTSSTSSTSTTGTGTGKNTRRRRIDAQSPN